MARSVRGANPLGLLLAGFCLGAAALVPARVPGAGPRNRPPLGVALGDEAISSLPAGARRLFADAAWRAAVQHYGSRRLEDAVKFPRLRSLIGLSLRFDPDLRPAALEGALLLAEPPPLGAGQPLAADRLLSGWATRHPTDWEALLLRGLVRHWHLHDPAGAAEVFSAAGRVQGAPAWFAALAARSWAEAGNRAASRSLWRALLARAGNERAKANAATHLLQLDALERLDELALLIQEFERENGRRPEVWVDLVAAGLLGNVPLDPAGMPFRLEEGVPRIARESPLAGAPGR